MDLLEAETFEHRMEARMYFHACSSLYYRVEYRRNLCYCPPVPPSCRYVSARLGIFLS